MPTKVLIVDDRDIILLTQEKLWKSKYNIKPDTAKSADEALRKIKNNSYDIIILDVLMPGMSGKELVQKLRRVKFNTPIIMLSGEDNVNTVKECLGAGANDYILKPINEEVYFQKIQKQINIVFIGKKPKS